MTKLFYDDPLKAAWMAREYGVEVSGQKGFAIIYVQMTTR